MRSLGPRNMTRVLVERYDASPYNPPRFFASTTQVLPNAPYQTGHGLGLAHLAPLRQRVDELLHKALEARQHGRRLVARSAQRQRLRGSTGRQRDAAMPRALVRPDGIAK